MAPAIDESVDCGAAKAGNRAYKQLQPSWYTSAAVNHAEADHAEVDHAEVDHAEMNYAEVHHAELHCAEALLKS